ncbi:peptidoglycan editing factor PgeF [Scandinavium sp. V105_16]|uniref:Purine nucleoside phosphorylase n=1 Tax=Scandinavium lactucae TaxID=3095028 RepID=A0AAJ2VTG1_9ENTR|nr:MULTISPECIES: peptidoglycan editing factor PgeF [unclassified Scandinavium]MDX6020896.1 peptidoglycan editing factor PgeF [Scandinavium sp. V105_16]MDX6030882.1 peptidoglycan editing factor PgeF [Scandinavium sp. V105_12]MDX6041531.1 peptidoglycan editing factor PgeF [Scandinavium sp. V105_6]MDX6052012.1 peptidoglycan editing factor PgeF [Scandinavium sp. V105_1]
MAYFSRLLADVPGVRHAFLDVHESTAFDKSKIVDIKQVHGADILNLTKTPDERPHVDGVFTSMAAQQIGVLTADCLPLLMASRDGQFIASVHAGWRGTALGIVQASVKQFAAAGFSADDIIVAVGPHIRPCCYEVSGDFYRALLATPAAERVRQHQPCLFSDTPRGQNVHSAQAREENSQWFDLSAFCQLELLDAGVKANNIDWLETCTYCTPEALGSYRRRTHVPATKTQQVSWIVRDN